MEFVAAKLDIILLVEFVEYADGIKFMIRDLVFAEFLAIKIEFIVFHKEDVFAYLTSTSWAMVVALHALLIQLLM